MQPQTRRTIDKVTGIAVFVIGVTIVIFFGFVKNDMAAALFFMALLGAAVWLYDRYQRHARKRDQAG
jgi:hypothetical protein